MSDPFRQALDHVLAAEHQLRRLILAPPHAQQAEAAGIVGDLEAALATLKERV